MELAILLLVALSAGVIGFAMGRQSAENLADAARDELAQLDRIRQVALKAERQQIASSPLGRLALAQDTGDPQ